MDSIRGSNHSSVLRLYEAGSPPRYEKQSAGSSGNYELVDLSKDLLHRELQRTESRIYGSSFDRLPVNVLQGNGYTLTVCSRKGSRKEPLKNMQSVRPRLQNPEPFLRLLDQSAFKSVRDAKLIHPMFLVEASETNPVLNGLELQLNISKKNNFTLKYIILQQDISTMEWSDITNVCTTGNGFCPEISIPAQKSAKIWALHLKRSLCNHIPSLLALLNGQIIFHISLYYQVLKNEVKVRIIGMSEELTHNRKRLKTAVTVTDEDGFRRGGESGPMFLSRKEGSLNVEFYKDGNCFKSSEFDFAENDTLYRDGEWHECTFDVKDLNNNLDVDIIDSNGYVQWSIDLNKILCLEQGGNDISVGNEFLSVEDLEQHCHQIPWIGPHMNTQYTGTKADCTCKLELKRLKSSRYVYAADNDTSFKCSTSI